MQQGEKTPTDRSTTFERLGLWLGIIAPVFMVGGFFAVDEGGTELSGSGAEIVAHLASIHGRIVIGNMIGVLGGLALLGFVASLRLRLARAGGQGEWLASVAFASGVIMAIGAIVQGTLRLAIASIVSSDLPHDEMLHLWKFEGVIAILAWGAVGLVAIMCVSAFAVRLIPRLLAGVGAVLVTATIVLTPTDHGGVSLTLFLWLIAASSFLILRTPSGPSITGNMRSPVQDA
jgi:hypothetical protein